MNATTAVEDEVEDDESDDEGEESGALTLVFTSSGQCVLEEDDETVWTSDSDDDFQTEFGTEFLDADTDSARILNWLEEEGWLDEEDKKEVVIETETDGDEDDEGF